MSAGALRGTLEGIRVNAPTGVPQRFTVALVGAARLEITIDNDLRLESVNAKFRRRPLQGAADTAHTNNDLNRLKPEPNGRFALEDPIPGIYDVLLVGMRAPGDHWMAAATEVVVAPSKVTVCTAASARLRKVGIGAPSGADASTFVGWRAIPRGPSNGSAAIWRSPSKATPRGVWPALVGHLRSRRREGSGARLAHGRGRIGFLRCGGAGGEVTGEMGSGTFTSHVTSNCGGSRRRA